MDESASQIQSLDHGPERRNQENHSIRLVLPFPSPSDLSARCLLRSFTKPEQINLKHRRKAKKLLSKHTKPYWPLFVGARVAAISDGKIVRGAILATKAHPLRPAAFRRKGFAGCWILLDSGERVVGYELRPIEGPQTKSC